VSSFQDLLAEIRACTICEEHLCDGVRPVLQVHPDARLLIAGQAPGRKVHESGVPFDDASGERLRQWMGVSRDTFYDPRQVAIVPMGFCFPGTGKSGDLAPRKECAPAWRAPILEHLSRVQLTLVIGRYAQAHYFPDVEQSLTETVQDWRNYLPGQLPLPHPSPRNHLWLRRNPWFEEELLPELQKRIQAILV